MKKYVSFSELYLFNRDPKEWHRRYIDGIQFEPNDKMRLGSLFHKAVENKYYDWQHELVINGLYKYQKPFAKALQKIQPYLLGEAEGSLIAKLPTGDDILCIFDRSSVSDRTVDDVKTYTNNEDGREMWNQFIVDHHKQLTVYAVAWWLSKHQYLREMRIFATNLSKGNVHVYKTTRGPADIAIGLEWIINTVQKIKKTGLWEKRLGSKDISKLNNLKLFD